MSESQERMLICTSKGDEDNILKIFHKWGLEAVVIGYVIAEPKVLIRSQGKLICDAPTEELAKAPIYDMPFKKSKIPNPNQNLRYVLPAIHCWLLARSFLRARAPPLAGRVGAPLCL